MENGGGNNTTVEYKVYYQLEDHNDTEWFILSNLTKEPFLVFNELPMLTTYLKNETNGEGATFELNVTENVYTPLVENGKYRMFVVAGNDIGYG